MVTFWKARMDAEIIRGLLTSLILLWACCSLGTSRYLPPTGRHHLPSLEQFCEETDNLRLSLAETLPSLIDDISDSMIADEHAMLEYIDYRRAFPHEQTMTSLTNDLSLILGDLRCMGRALDIHKRHHTNNRHRHHLRRLFHYHTLPTTAQQLVSRQYFGQTFRTVTDHFDQLQRSISLRGRAVTEGACELWKANRASVLVFSLATLVEAESFVDDVSNHCSGRD